MAEYVGYTALCISLLSVNMNNMLWFRCLHLLASCIYLVYGVMIEAMPLVIGASLFTLIHTYRIFKHIKERNELDHPNQNSN